MTRDEALASLSNLKVFDVVIIGAGINGATLFDSLCRQGYRALLIDKADFANGSSQSSGMMIWGGLLYLTNLEFGYVAKLSSDRDAMIQEKNQWVTPKMMRYIPLKKMGRSKWWVYVGLWFYWVLSFGRRKMPKVQRQFSERDLLNPAVADSSLCYEEAVLETSDARFVYRQIAPHQTPEQLAINYCTVCGRFDDQVNAWQLDLKDQLTLQNHSVRAKMIVNCAGVWTDEVNAKFDIKAPVKHVYSKGVYIGFSRPSSHESSVFFDLGEHDDVITYVPWGSVSLWGPTETMESDLAKGYEVSSADIDYLIRHYNQRFKKQVTRSDIVSLRCGVRPLVVPVDSAMHEGYPLDLSRNPEVIVDSKKPWISCYGGKITGATRMAAVAMSQIQKVIRPIGVSHQPLDGWESQVPWIKLAHFPYPLPSPRWCAEHEQCLTLSDYLRRRTNVAQWNARCGLGLNNENFESIMFIAIELSLGDATKAQTMYREYHDWVVHHFDQIIAATPYS